MKRLTLFILLQALLMLCSTVCAESSYVTIGDGTNSSYFYGYGGGYYSTTQTIYTAEEIGKAGYITALAYNVATASAKTTIKLEIYLGITSKDAFDDANDGLTADELTLVYSGSPTLGNTTGWMDHIFQTKFSFDGTSNLVVVVCRESTADSPDCYYTYGYSKKNLYRWDCFYKTYSDIQNLDGYTTSSSRQNTRFKIESFPTISVNNINYTVTSEDDKTVSVAPSSYSGIISIPATVTYNGSSYSVTSVGKDAFSGCTGLTYVVLGNNIKTIGANAFKGCTGLTTVKLPTQLETIGNYAFYDCQNCNFSALSLNEGLTNIGDYAFYNCDKIASVIMPSTLTHLGNNAFRDCALLETAILPGSLKSIAEYCFYGCVNLSSVNMPSMVSSIGKYAFCDCSKLTHIDITSAITAIGEYAFHGAGLSSLILPQNVTSVGNHAFYVYNGNLKEVTIDNPIIEKDYTNGTYAKTLCDIFSPYIEKYIIGDTPTKIGKNAFYCSYSSGNTSLKEVVMGKNIKEVGDYAFSSCNAIEKVYYPDIESLCSINFSSSSSNPSYCQTAKVYIAGEELREELVIPNTVTSIGSYAFGNAKITSVSIPSSVISIDQYAFDGCKNLYKVYIDSPSLVEKDYSSISPKLIGRFDRYTEHVTELVIGDSPTKIGAQAFYGSSYSQLTSVTIGKNVREIGENAFGYNSNITKVEFTSITALCETTFGNNTANPLTFENANLYVNGELVENVVIPNGVTSISNYAFYNAKSIRSVDIPMSVASIGQYSLYGCSNLDDIYVHWQYPPVIAGYGGKYGNLHVPIGMKDNYSTKNYWKSFTIIADQDYKTVSDIQFSELCYRCEIGEIGQVEFSLYPEDALIKDVVIESDGSSAIYFDSNTRQFVGLEDGVATITVTSRDKDAYSESIKIYVGNVPVEDAISLDRNSLNLRVGYNDVLTVSQITTNGSDKPVTWTSSNTSVATVSNGVVTGVGEGIATITASISGGKSATCTVTVYMLKTAITDGSSNTYTNSTTEIYDQITYTRNYSNTKWQSLYVPFAMRYEDWKDEYDVAYINSVRQYDNDNDGTIDETIMDVLQITGGELYPNMPYLIKAKTTGEKTITLQNAMLYQTEENSLECSTMLSTFTFTGTYSTIPAATLKENGYYAMGGGGLIMTNGTSNLKPFRWYMGITSRSPMYNTSTDNPSRISVHVIGEEDDMETSLYGVDREEELDDQIFNLNGQMMDASEPLTPGLYIKNGKKVIIR